MKEMQDFLDGVLEKKLDARAKGYEMDLMVLHTEFKYVLFGALPEYEGHNGQPGAIRTQVHLDGRMDVYIYGVKVMWSQARLPKGQVWFRLNGKGGRL